MRDPYEILGVQNTASDAEIKSAYRLLAKRLHPDIASDDDDREERFKEVTAAYEFLKDPVRRDRFDRGEIDATGARRRRTARSHASASRAEGNFRARRQTGQRSAGPDARSSARERNSNGFAEDAFDAEEDAVRSRYHEIFADFFGGTKNKSGTSDLLDQSYRIAVTFEEAALGIKRRLRLTSDRKVDVRIPAGVRDGQQIRLKGMGKTANGRTGDALVTVEVAPHAFFSRQNDDVLLTLPVTLVEAVLGAKVRVPTINGPVQVTVPPGSNTGKTLRLKGRGIQPDKVAVAGDQLVTLQIVLPDDPPKDFVKTVKKWADKWPGSVRNAFGLE